jgi:hypothetical protein
VSKITANAAAAAAATANEIRARSDRDHSEIRAATYQPAVVESTVPTEHRLVSRLPLYTGYDQPAADRDHGYRLQEVLSPGAAAMFAQEAVSIDARKRTCVVLDKVNRRLVAVPSVESLLGQ